MTDVQAIVSAVLGSAAGIAGAIRWGMGKIAKAQDRSIAALVKSAESNAVLVAKFESLTGRIEGLAARLDWFVELLFAGAAPASGASTSTGVPASAREVKSNKVVTAVTVKATRRAPTPRPDSNDGG